MFLLLLVLNKRVRQKSRPLAGTHGREELELTLSLARENLTWAFDFLTCKMELVVLAQLCFRKL